MIFGWQGRARYGQARLCQAWHGQAGQRKGFSASCAFARERTAMRKHQSPRRGWAGQCVARQGQATQGLASTDRAQLTDGQRNKLDDATGRLGDQRAFFRRQTFDIRKLLPGPKPSKDTE